MSSVLVILPAFDIGIWWYSTKLVALRSNKSESGWLGIGKPKDSGFSELTLYLYNQTQRVGLVQRTLSSHLIEMYNLATILWKKCSRGVK